MKFIVEIETEGKNPSPDTLAKHLNIGLNRLADDLQDDLEYHIMVIKVKEKPK